MTADATQKPEKYNHVYGRYSSGSHPTPGDPDRVFGDIDDPVVMDPYRNIIKRDLDRIGISERMLRDYKVLDVGSGRQSIMFNTLGAETVDHRDLSEDNVRRMQSYISSHSLEPKLTSRRWDLVTDSLPANHYDFVYLNGIVQHFSHVGIGLRNCMQSVKKNGYLWLYFYRSGSFYGFIVELARDLVAQFRPEEVEESKSNQKTHYINMVLAASETGVMNGTTSAIMDNLYVTYLHLYCPNQYMSFVRECGFEIVGSSGLEPFGKNISHKYAHGSTILMCQRTGDVDIASCDVEILSPENHINTLDRTIHSPVEGNEGILCVLDSYEALKQCTKKYDVPESTVGLIAYRLRRFGRDYEDCTVFKARGLGRDHDGIESLESPDIHYKLAELIDNIRSLIEPFN